MASPLNSTRPVRGRRKPTMVLKAVDFPAPLGPMMLTISCTSTVSETSCRMSIRP
jgi:hypothetical protein